MSFLTSQILQLSQNVPSLSKSSFLKVLAIEPLPDSDSQFLMFKMLGNTSNKLKNKII